MCSKKNFTLDLENYFKLAKKQKPIIFTIYRNDINIFVCRC